MLSRLAQATSGDAPLVVASRGRGRGAHAASRRPLARPRGDRGASAALARRARASARRGRLRLRADCRGAGPGRAPWWPGRCVATGRATSRSVSNSSGPRSTPSAASTRRRSAPSNGSTGRRLALRPSGSRSATASTGSRSTCLAGAPEIEDERHSLQRGELPAPHALRSARCRGHAARPLPPTEALMLLDEREAVEAALSDLDELARGAARRAGRASRAQRRTRRFRTRRDPRSRPRSAGGRTAPTSRAGRRATSRARFRLPFASRAMPTPAACPPPPRTPLRELRRGDRIVVVTQQAQRYARGARRAGHPRAACSDSLAERPEPGSLALVQGALPEGWPSRRHRQRRHRADDRPRAVRLREETPARCRTRSTHRSQLSRRGAAGRLRGPRRPRHRALRGDCAPARSATRSATTSSCVMRATTASTCQSTRSTASRATSARPTRLRG